MSVSVEQGPASVVTVRVSGRLNSKQWLAAQQDVGKLMKDQSAVSLLVIAENFQGWEGTDWNDMTFQVEHDDQIERMAIVAEKKWEDKVLLFAGQGIRKFEICYFPPPAIAEARTWLASAG